LRNAIGGSFEDSAMHFVSGGVPLLYDTIEVRLTALSEDGWHVLQHDGLRIERSREFPEAQDEVVPGIDRSAAPLNREPLTWCPPCDDIRAAALPCHEVRKFFRFSLGQIQVVDVGTQVSRIRRTSMTVEVGGEDGFKARHTEAQ
jgi:hypothetical protein